MAEAEAGQGRSLGEHAQELGDQVKRFVHTEIELARQEMTGQTRELGLASGMVGGAGVLAALSAGTGTAGLVMLLARRMPPWLAAFTVSGGYAAGAAALAMRGRQRIEEVGVPAPDQAIDILKDTAQRVTGG
jgi:hypothetical protein